jgi:hypothetical protein
MRILAFILILICSAASAETFQNRTYELFDGRRSADPAPLILSLHGAGGNGPGIGDIPTLMALQRVMMSLSPTLRPQVHAGMTGAGTRWDNLKRRRVMMSAG